MKKYHRNNVVKMARVFDDVIAKLVRHQANKFKAEYFKSERAAIHQYDLEKFGIHRWQAIHHVRTALTKAQKAKVVRELILNDELYCWWAYCLKSACMQACSKKPDLI